MMGCGSAGLEGQAAQGWVTSYELHMRHLPVHCCQGPGTGHVLAEPEAQEQVIGSQGVCLILNINVL